MSNGESKHGTHSTSTDTIDIVFREGPKRFADYMKIPEARKLHRFVLLDTVPIYCTYFPVPYYLFSLVFTPFSLVLS